MQSSVLAHLTRFNIRKVVLTIYLYLWIVGNIYDCASWVSNIVV